MTAANSRKRPPTVLTTDEITAIMRACSRRAPTGARNAALIAVMWRCGLRVSEALALEPSDIDFEAGTVRVRHGKGDRSRTVGLDAGTAGVLGRWMDKRKALGFNGRHALFCTITAGTRKGVELAPGSQLDTSYVRHLLPRLAAKAGVERRVHAHALRHTYSAELAREGVPMNVLRDALGHSSLATTDRYLRDVAPVHVIDTMRAREWSM